MRLFRTGLACAALAAVAWTRAGAMDFSSGLSASERASAGIAALTSHQSAVLDGLVARDAKLAREGGVTGFSTAFSARHSEQERAGAGIARLGEKERQMLDMLVARSIAMGPPPDEGFVYSPPQPTPPPTEVEVSAPPKTEVHGDVSLTVGSAGHGRSFYGTSMDLFVTDPKHGFTVGVGFQEFRGKGLLALCGPYGPFGPYAPGYDGPPYLGW